MLSFSTSGINLYFSPIFALKPESVSVLKTGGIFCWLTFSTLTNNFGFFSGGGGVLFFPRFTRRVKCASSGLSTTGNMYGLAFLSTAAHIIVYGVSRFSFKGSCPATAVNSFPSAIGDALFIVFLSISAKCPWIKNHAAFATFCGCGLRGSNMYLNFSFSPSKTSLLLCPLDVSTGSSIIISGIPPLTFIIVLPLPFLLVSSGSMTSTWILNSCSGTLINACGTLHITC